MEEYILAYSLGSVERQPTSVKAREAFKASLVNSGWASNYHDLNGKNRILSETTLIGGFLSPEIAKASVRIACGEAQKAEGPFYLSRAVISAFSLVWLHGPEAPATVASRAIDAMRSARTKL